MNHKFQNKLGETTANWIFEGYRKKPSLPIIDELVQVEIVCGKMTIAERSGSKTEFPWYSICGNPYKDSDIAGWWHLPKAGTGNKV